jgi:cysteinyl-tRNA synthetase
MALRLYFLQTHYRVPLTFHEEALTSAGRGLRRLRQALAPVPDEPAPPAEPPAFVREARERFEQAMDDDLNTAGALAVLFELASAINARRATAPAEAAAGQAALRALAGVLGLDLARAEPERDAHAAEPFIELLLAVRQELRAAKQWALADRIREGLRERGVIVEDTPQGPTYRFE